MRVQIIIPDKLLEDLDSHCASNGYTRSEFIRLCIRAEIDSLLEEKPVLLVQDLKEKDLITKPHTPTPPLQETTIIPTGTDADEFYPKSHAQEISELEAKEIKKRLEDFDKLVPVVKEFWFGGKKYLVDENGNETLANPVIKTCKHEL